MAGPLSNRVTLSALLFFVSITLVGCPSTGGVIPFTADKEKPDPRLTESSSAKFFSKSGGTACAVGATIGAATCLLGSPDKRAECMIARGLLGCGGAMTANYILDAKRSQYADSEDRINAMIADVQKVNEELKLLTQTAQSVIEDDKQQLAQINEDIAANKLQKEVAERQLALIDANTEYLKEKMTVIRESQAEWQKVANTERKEGAQVDALDAEINRMQSQIAALESEVDQLYEQRTSIQLT